MSALLDVALVILLLAYLVYGYRRGLIRSLGALIGIAAGALAAILLSPLVATFTTTASVRVIATILVSCLLILIGHAIGAAIGRLIGRRVLKSPLGFVDRFLGAVVNLAVAALVVSAVASLVAALGVPFLAQPIASSAVLRTITSVTPAPIGTALAQLRTTVIQNGLPDLDAIIGTPVQQPVVPKVATDTAAATAAAASVVKVTGTAYACGQDQSGSGFVVAPGRVLTNAHVLAGVASPVVLTQDGTALVGSVVSFDVHRDLAVIDVQGLKAPALRLAAMPKAGDVGIVDGYPFGGPFTSGGARVIDTSVTTLADISGGGSTARSIATIAADVEQGNSGGPLLTRSGSVAGIVFAKSSTTADVGYAMTVKEIASLVHRAGSLTSTVSTGRCSRG